MARKQTSSRSGSATVSSRKSLAAGRPSRRKGGAGGGTTRKEGTGAARESTTRDGGVPSSAFLKKLKLQSNSNLQGIHEYKLKTNGMRVLLVENHSTPIVAVTMVYHIGSRNEAVGYTGSTHFLEHMMFKGTKKYDPVKETGIDDVLKKVGGINNATTWYDRTNYFEVVPSRYLELCLDIESDRMRNLLLRESDRQAEMTVVRNELERGEDDPDELLDTNLFATAYREHPYHHPVIGWRSDVEGVPTERLRKFYKDFYWPENATLIVIGDIDQKNALTLVSRYFAPIPKAPDSFPAVYTCEPPQEGERRFVLRRGSDNPRLAIAYHVPECLHEDTYALDVAETILGDSSRRSSRLYKALIDKGLASDVDASNYSLKDPGLFILSAQANTGVKLEKIESVILNQLDRFFEDKISDRELTRAKQSIVKRMKLAIADPLGYSMHLTEAIAVADWKWWLDYPVEIEKVTRKDIRRVIKKYFASDNRTVGYYYPKPREEKRADATPQSVQEVAPAEPEKQASESAKSKQARGTTPVLTKLLGGAPVEIKLGARVERVVLDNGLTVLTLPLKGSSTVAVSGKVRAGDQQGDIDKSQVPMFVSSLLAAGSSRYPKTKLSDKLESMGADLDFTVTTFWSEFDSHVVKEDLADFVDVLADVLQNPTLKKKELSIEKKLRRTELKERKADTSALTWNAMVQGLYKPTNGFYQKTFDEQAKELGKISRSDIARFHRKFFTPDRTILAFVGDITAREAEKLARQHFSDWKRPGKKKTGSQKVPLITRGDLRSVDKCKEYKLSIPDKANADVRIAKTLPVDIHSDDYFATVIANATLGYGSFASRLAPVRDKYGLTYGIYSVINDPTSSFSPWYIKYSVNPANLDRAQSIIRGIVDEYVKDGITDDELKTEKSHLAGVYSVRLRSPRRIAGSLTFYELAGVPPSFMDQYPARLARVTRGQVNKAIRKYLDISRNTVTAISGTLEKRKSN